MKSSSKKTGSILFLILALLILTSSWVLVWYYGSYSEGNKIGYWLAIVLMLIGIALGRYYIKKK